MKKIPQIITHFTDNDLYTFTVGYYIIMNYPRAQAHFRFFDRNNTVYPAGFAALLEEQMQYMENVVITDEEIEFMLKKCYYLPRWYINTFLRGFRFNSNNLVIRQDAEGHLKIDAIADDWFSASMWEMPVLSTISELMHRLNGDFDKYDIQVERQRIIDKTNKMLDAGLCFSDFGTRRRFSYDHHEMVVKTMAEMTKDNISLGQFAGTSNVYFAMKYDLTPIGTMSHQIVSFEENVASVFEVNYSVMNKWAETYGGDLGVYLYDCFGDDVFFDNFSKKYAMLFSGLRVDSGKEEEQIHKIVTKYKKLGINPATKQVVFSNGLDADRAIQLHYLCKGLVQDSYGIGTNITCDVTDVKPMNIVMKLIEGRITEKRNWMPCVKLSCDKGKTLGDSQKCKYLSDLISAH